MNKVFFGIIWLILIIVGAIALVNLVLPNKPTFNYPTFTQHQQLELRVERLEKIVGLKGEEMRKEGIQYKIK